MADIIDTLSVEIGHTRYSDWLTIDQSMIDSFADVTDDHQFIHVDPVAAAATPFGGTIAHGFLTLSLLTRLLADIDRPKPEGIRMGVNYGLDTVRFITPVRSGSRVRGAFTLTAIEQKRPGQYQQAQTCTIEIEDADKPALVAIWLGQFFV